MDTAWTYQWFLFDGYFNLVYLFVFVSISFLWRPTSENQRYGLSQLASDESEADGHYAMEVVFGNGDDELGLDGEPDEDLEAGDDVMKWVEENILAAGGPDAEDEEAQRQAVHRALADEEEVEDLVPRKR